MPGSIMPQHCAAHRGVALVALPAHSHRFYPPSGEFFFGKLTGTIRAIKDRTIVEGVLRSYSPSDLLRIVVLSDLSKKAWGGAGTWRMAPPRVRRANAHQTASNRTGKVYSICKSDNRRTNRNLQWSPYTIFRKRVRTLGCTGSSRATAPVPSHAAGGARRRPCRVLACYS